MEKMVNYMLTKEGLYKEKLNNMDFFEGKRERYSERVEIQAFIFFYATILQYAYEIMLIGEEVRNNISNLLMQEINKQANSNPNIIANYLYVTTLYLQSKSNWEAFEELCKITDEKEASNFVLKVSDWIVKQLNSMVLKLRTTKKDVVELGDKTIIEAYNSLESEILTFRKFGIEREKISLKKLHQGIVLAYEPLAKVNNDNYFLNLKECTKRFITEVSIMLKIDAKAVVAFRRKQINKIRSSEERKVSNLIVSEEEELRKLKEKFEDDLEKAYIEQEELGKFINECEDKIRREHPGIEEEELEVLIEEYMENLPEEDFPVSYYDENELKRQYEADKEAIAQKYSNKEKNLNKKMEGENFVISNETTLTDIIKEIALYYLASNGIINYPESLKDREELLSKMPIEESIRALLLSERAKSLSEEEKQYLNVIAKKSKAK